MCLTIVTLGRYVAADRLTPFSSGARVKAIISPLVAEVSGKLTSVPVKNGTLVGAGSASILAAQAKVVRATANLANIRVQSERVFQHDWDGIASKAQGDNARAELASSESTPDDAQAELERATKQLGPDGENNPQVKGAMAGLAQAELIFFAPRSLPLHAVASPIWSSRPEPMRLPEKTSTRISRCAALCRARIVTSQ